MISSGIILARLYAWLLNFYPKSFRHDFGAEMQTVFEQAMLEAFASRQAVVFFMHELRDLPVALLHAYLQERRLQNMSISSDEKPIRWWGVLAGMGLFLVPMIFELPLETINLPLSIIFRVIFLIFMLAVLLYGIFKGLSRWSLPALGFVLGIGWIYAGSQLIASWLLPLLERLLHVDRQAFRYGWGAVMDGLVWGGLFLILLIFVLIFYLLPPLRTLYRRIRNDWTLVSLTLYGAILLALFIDWDEYTREEFFVALCYLFLALGAAGYLLRRKANFRIIWLLAGAALAMLTMSVGKCILVPLQDWPQWLTWHPAASERWYESFGALIELGWIAFALLAPSLIKLLPLPKPPVVENPDIPPLKEDSALFISPR